MGRSWTLRGFYQARLRCPDCGHEQTILRRKGRPRGAGHRKWLWCPRCKARTNHVEQPRYQTGLLDSGGDQVG